MQCHTIKIIQKLDIYNRFNKKLSYRRETARQLPMSRGGGLDPPVNSPSSGYTYMYAYGRIRKPQHTYVKRAVRKAHFKLNRAFKVIQGHPYWCRQESRMSVVVMGN